MSNLELSRFLKTVIGEALDHFDKLTRGAVSRNKKGTSLDESWFSLSPARVLLNNGFYKMTLDLGGLVDVRAIIQVKKMTLDRADSLEHLASLAVAKSLNHEIKELCLFQFEWICRKCVQTEDCTCCRSEPCWCAGALRWCNLPCTSTFCGLWSQPALHEVQGELSKLGLPEILIKRVVETVVWQDWTSSLKCTRLPHCLIDYCAGNSIPLPFPINWWGLQDYI